MPVPVDQSNRVVIEAGGRPMPAGVPTPAAPASWQNRGPDRGQTCSRPQGHLVRLARRGMLACVIAFGGVDGAAVRGSRDRSPVPR